MQLNYFLEIMKDFGCKDMKAKQKLRIIDIENGWYGDTTKRQKQILSVARENTDGQKIRRL